MEQLEARPPYIIFEQRAVARQKPATEGGGLYYVDVDFALVTPHGSKDSIEKVVAEWFPRLDDEARQGRIPRPWVAAYKEAYQAWKSDQPLPINGTPIKNWPAVTPAEVKNMTAFGVLAVEDMAAANEELLQRIGMGARRLKQLALDFLQANTDHGPLVAQVDSQRAIIAGQQSQIDTLKLELQQLKAALTVQQSTAAQYAQAGLPQPVEWRDNPREDKHADDKLIDKEVDEALS
jgi:hypothetical protein